MNHDLDFAAVLSAARSGEPWACTRIWSTYAPLVAGYARSHGSREPEDLTSEVFLSLFRGIGTFTGDESAFRGHLFTIARRRLVDEFRASSRRVIEQAWSESVAHEPTASAEEQALSATSKDRVASILGDLTPDQREVLTLRLVADLTVEQVARATQRSPGAVKALQHRALEALRRRIGPGVPASTSREEKAL